MTQRIPSPRRPLGDADMQIDCEFVVEGPVRALIDEIIQAGWPPAVAFAAVKWLLGYIRSHRFTAFAIYRIALGVALLLFLPAGG